MAAWIRSLSKECRDKSAVAAVALVPINHPKDRRLGRSSSSRAPAAGSGDRRGRLDQAIFPGGTRRKSAIPLQIDALVLRDAAPPGLREPTRGDALLWPAARCTARTSGRSIGATNLHSITISKTAKWARTKAPRPTSAPTSPRTEQPDPYWRLCSPPQHRRCCCC